MNQHTMWLKFSNINQKKVDDAAKKKVQNQNPVGILVWFNSKQTIKFHTNIIHQMTFGV